jgi:alkanesulfonate monooxygenase SsuD/methylene tetrahydromethanopterin reductase-like flavin-dependent oxidoreductase (luciferase family)
VLVQLVVVTPDRRSAAEDLAGRYGVEAGELLEAPFLLLGTHDQIADQLRERSARWDVETWTVFDSLPGADLTLTTLAPVIDLLKTS